MSLCLSGACLGLKTVAAFYAVADEQAAACGDINGATTAGGPFPCTGVYKAKQGATNVVI
jgi:hypothetical protein